MSNPFTDTPETTQSTSDLLKGALDKTATGLHRAIVRLGRLSKKVGPVLTDAQREQLGGLYTALNDCAGIVALLQGKEDD